MAQPGNISTLSAEATYSTKGNIVMPANPNLSASAQVTANDAKAAARMADVNQTGVTTALSSASKVAAP